MNTQRGRAATKGELTAETQRKNIERFFAIGQLTPAIQEI
jgi:hypothetical protein